MRTAWRILGTRLCIWYALWASQAATFTEFIGKFEGTESPRGGWGLDRRLLDEWKAGGRYISDDWVRLVDGEVAGAGVVHTIASLLQRNHLSAPDVQRTVKPICERTVGSRLWKLPCLNAPGAMGDEMTSYAWTDSASLVLRGDFLGFLAILALLRESIAIRNFGCSSGYARDLYAILPSVCRIGWVRQDVDLLLQCIEDMMVGIRWYGALTVIDWDAFRGEISNPRPWVGDPPWIVGHVADCARERPLTKRPVPLLEDVVPLEPYVRRSGPERQRDSADRANDTSGRSRRLKIFLNGLASSRGKPETPEDDSE